MEPESSYLTTPNGKFAKFELSDSTRHVIPLKPTAGTNLLDTTGTFYRTTPPVWAAPSAGSIVANFPENISTNDWPLYYTGVGLARSVNLAAHGNPKQINSLNLYDLYSISNEGDYTLTIQPVLYEQRIGTNTLDRVDLPSVATKVHLVPNVK